jgi:hypothetical protein
MKGVGPSDASSSYHHHEAFKITQIAFQMVVQKFSKDHRIYIYIYIYIDISFYDANMRSCCAPVPLTRRPQKSSKVDSTCKRCLCFRKISTARILDDWVVVVECCMIIFYDLH